MTNFITWTQENLAQFAQEAVDKMTEQHEQIQQLQCDLKDAIEAYRALIRQNAVKRSLQMPHGSLLQPGGSSLCQTYPR